MKKAKILILSQILILASLFVAPGLVNRAHASSSGLVCITFNGATSCPLIPPVLAHPLNGTQLRVAIVISNSTAINGFDITLLTNHTILKPAGADLTGSVLTNPTIIDECLGGVIKSGPVCLPTDTVNTLHFVVSSFLSVTPITGLLFTAIYNITGTASTTPVGFQTGCGSPSAPTSDPPLCITMSNGGITPVPETVQTASFSNLPGVPSFTINANPTTLQIIRGATGNSQIIATSLNNFTGLVTLSTTLSPVGPTVFLGSSSLLIPPNGQNFTTLTVNTAPTLATGIYNVTVSAMNGAITRSAPLIVIVASSPPPSPDFSFSAIPPALSIGQGNSANTSMTATSIGGFSGTIFISLISIAPSAPNGIALRWFSTIVLSNGGTGKAILIVDTFYNTQPGNYSITMIGSSGSISHSITVRATVTPLSAFGLNAVPNILVVPSGSSNSSTIEVSSNSMFTGTISLIVTSFPPGLPAVLSKTSVTLNPSQTVNSTLTFPSNGTLAGYFSVNVTGTSGGKSHSTFVQVHIIGITPPPTPDFTIIASPTFLTVPAGANASSTITLTSVNGFSGIINFTATVSPLTFNPPSARLIPSLVILPAGGNRTVTLLVSTSASTPGQFFTITVAAIGGGVIHFVNVQLQVLAPPDEHPVASFTFTPSNPVVGQSISFDGSGSVDPDGTVVSWTWNFGDGFISFGEFTSHSYNSAGNHTVTLTVQDISGLSSFTSATISVRPRPAHDVGIIEVFAQPTKVVSTQTVGIQVEVTNTGSTNETVSVTAYANGRPVQTVKGIFLPACVQNSFPFCFSVFYVQILWDTSGVVPGNYTISASVSLPSGEVDPTPADNNVTDGTVTVLPAPVITLSPNSGVDGTKVLIQGSGFPVQQQFGFVSIGVVYVNFDNMSVGFTFSHNGTFSFIFDVPLSQLGSHGVFAFDPYSGAHASSVFTVLPTPTGSLAVSVDMGSIYFPGDTAVAYVLTTFNGAPIGPQNVQVQVILFKPDGTNVTLTATSVGRGLYKATYAVPSTGAVLGTYLVLAKAHQNGPIDATALVSFEVKLTWINSNGGKITVGATTLAGVIGVGAVAWKKGYLRRKSDQEPVPAFPF